MHLPADKVLPVGQLGLAMHLPAESEVPEGQLGDADFTQLLPFEL